MQLHYQVIDTGEAYVVAYPNHRGELIAVLECANKIDAAFEAARMNAERNKPKPTTGGNRYLRQFN